MSTLDSALNYVYLPLVVLEDPPRTVLWRVTKQRATELEPGPSAWERLVGEDYI